MELFEVLKVGDKTIRYNTSALVPVRFSSLWKKDFFGVLKKLLPIEKMSEDEATEYICSNGDVIECLFEISYTSISLANPSAYEGYDEFLQSFKYTELLNIGVEVVKGLFTSLQPCQKQRVKSNSKKK